MSQHHAAAPERARHQPAGATALAGAGAGPAAAAAGAGAGRSSVAPSRAGPPPPRTYEWEIRHDELQIDTAHGLLGEGFFGSVFKAVWAATESVVCVKRLKNVRAGELHNFWSEVSLCARLRCPQLVQFLGAVTDPKHLAIVTEYMTGGTLYDFLHRRKQPGAPALKPNGGGGGAAAAASTPSAVAGGAAGAAAPFSHALGEAFVVRSARQIASGMNYLALHGIVHRDLTSSNVLLDGDQWNCKVSDFGLSRNADAQISGAGGSLPYMAPEAFTEQTYNTATDVYAYGVVLYELLTLTVPYSNVFAGAGGSSSAMAIGKATAAVPLSATPALAASRAAQGLRPTLPAALTSNTATAEGKASVWGQLAALVQRCWSQQPAQRPTFKEIIQLLVTLEPTSAAGGASGAGNSSASSSGGVGSGSGSSTGAMVAAATVSAGAHAAAVAAFGSALPSAGTALSREFSMDNALAHAPTVAASSGAAAGSGSQQPGLSRPASSELQYLPVPPPAAATASSSSASAALTAAAASSSSAGGVVAPAGIPIPLRNGNSSSAADGTLLSQQPRPANTALRTQPPPHASHASQPQPMQPPFQSTLAAQLPKALAAATASSRLHASSSTNSLVSMGSTPPDSPLALSRDGSFGYDPAITRAAAASTSAVSIPSSRAATSGSSSHAATAVAQQHSRIPATAGPAAPAGMMSRPGGMPPLLQSLWHLDPKTGNTAVAAAAAASATTTDSGPVTPAAGSTPIAQAGQWMPPPVGSPPPAQSPVGPLSPRGGLPIGGTHFARDASYDAPLSPARSRGNSNSTATMSTSSHAITIARPMPMAAASSGTTASSKRNSITFADRDRDVSAAALHAMASPGSSPTAMSLLLAHQHGLQKQAAAAAAAATQAAAWQQSNTALHGTIGLSGDFSAAAKERSIESSGGSGTGSGGGGGLFGDISDEIGGYLSVLREHLGSLPPTLVTHKPAPPAAAPAPTPLGSTSTGSSRKSALSASLAAAKQQAAAAEEAKAPQHFPVMSVRAPAHECSSSLNSARLYPATLPSVGELVVARTVRSKTATAAGGGSSSGLLGGGSASGGSGGAGMLGGDGDLASCLFSLPEYGSAVYGMAAVAELSRRRIRSVAKLVRAAGSTGDDVLRVIRADKAGNVDLSKRDITEREKQHTLSYHRQALVVHSIVCAVAAQQRCCVQCLYAHLVWPLATRYGNAFRAFRVALVDPVSVLGDFKHCACFSVSSVRAAAAAMSGSRPGGSSNSGSGSSGKTAAATTTAAAASALIFLSPRMLPEIERRLQYNRDTLDLSKLGLTTLPRALMQKYEKHSSASAMVPARVMTPAGSLAGGTSSSSAAGTPQQTLTPPPSRSRTPPSSATTDGKQQPQPPPLVITVTNGVGPTRSSSDETGKMQSQQQRSQPQQHPMAAIPLAAIPLGPAVPMAAIPLGPSSRGGGASLLTQQLQVRRSTSAQSSSSSTTASAPHSPSPSPVSPIIASAAAAALPSTAHGATAPVAMPTAAVSGSRPQQPSMHALSKSPATATSSTTRIPDQKPIATAGGHRASGSHKQQQQQQPKASPAAASSSTPRALHDGLVPLRNLSLEDNPFGSNGTGLPAEIGAFDRLEELNINHCALTDLPSSMQALSGSLSALLCYHNKLTRIPDVMCTLRALEVLNLSNNELTFLPDGFGQLTCLAELSLAHNLLTADSIPVLAFQPLTQLRTLDLSSNKLDALPAALMAAGDASSAGGGALMLPALQSLELRNNQLHGALPAALSNLVSLEWLDVSRNQLTAVDVLLPLAQAAAVSTTGARGGGGLAVLDVSHNPYLHLSQAALKTLSLIPEFQHTKCGTAPVPASGSAAAAAAAGMHLRTGGAKADAHEADAKHSHTLESRTVTPRHGGAAGAAAPVPAAAAAPAAPVKHIKHWDKGDVLQWLDAEGFGAYRGAFEENEITGASLIELDKDDLKELGVKKLGHLKSMQTLVKAERDKPIPKPAPASAFGSAAGKTAAGASAAAVAGARNGSPLPPSSPVLGKSPSATAAAGKSPAALALNSTAYPVYELAPVTCDPAHCELVRSSLLRAIHASPELREPVLVRCVVQMTCFRGRTGVDVIRAAAAAAKQLCAVPTNGSGGSAPPSPTMLSAAASPATPPAAAAAAAAAGVSSNAPPPRQSAGGPYVTPFDGLHGGLERATLRVTTILPPLYCLSVPALLPEQGVALLHDVVEVMRVVLNASAGHIAVCVPPYVVALPAAGSGADDPIADGAAAASAVASGDAAPADEIEFALEEVAMMQAAGRAPPPPDDDDAEDDADDDDAADGADAAAVPRVRHGRKPAAKASARLPASASVAAFPVGDGAAGAPQVVQYEGFESEAF